MRHSEPASATARARPPAARAELVGRRGGSASMGGRAVAKGGGARTRGRGFPVPISSHPWTDADQVEDDALMPPWIWALPLPSLALPSLPFPWERSRRLGATAQGGEEIAGGGVGLGCGGSGGCDWRRERR